MDNGKNTAVYAMYADSTKAANAVQALKDKSTGGDDIGSTAETTNNYVAPAKF
jgi:hypothetical protein